MTAISLDPLSPEESESLVEAFLAVDNLPAGITSQILDRAGGNPFFLEEIVESLIDNGMITKEGERWVASKDLAGFEVPDSIQAVLASRIDLLDPLDKRVLVVTGPHPPPPEASMNPLNSPSGARNFAPCFVPVPPMPGGVCSENRRST